MKVLLQGGKWVFSHSWALLSILCAGKGQLYVGPLYDRSSLV